MTKNVYKNAYPSIAGSICSGDHFVWDTIIKYFYNPSYNKKQSFTNLRLSYLILTGIQADKVFLTGIFLVFSQNIFINKLFDIDLDKYDNDSKFIKERSEVILTSFSSSNDYTDRYLIIHSGYK